MMGILPYTSESPLGLVMEMLTYAYSIDMFNETPKMPTIWSASSTTSHGNVTPHVPDEDIPFGATSCSSPFRKSGLDLNPFHQFVKDVFEGEVDETDAFDGGGDSAANGGRGVRGFCSWGC
jgi:hypothetical protein